MTADGQQQLMLSGRDPRGLCLALAPVQEPAQACAQLEQALVVAIGVAFGHPSALRYRATIS